MDYFIQQFLSNEGFNFEFKNELDVMVRLSKLPLAKIYLESEKYKYMQSKESAAELTAKSENLRAQGNKLFKDSPSKNALSAATLYTKAIFAAPLGSEALAFAHANRSAALQQFGYFREAYDDCLCALEQGYPEHLRHKLITRQAYCALSLNNASLLEQHLDELNSMKLNKNFTNDLQKLQKGLDELIHMGVKFDGPAEKTLALYRDKVEIIKSASKGRCMMATKPIKVNELIFSERATSFVPLKSFLICQKCAITEFIPFPCYRCNGKVVYCSVQCREAHSIIHGLECFGYQIGIFSVCEYAHLGLRVVLDGIQQIIPFLRSKRTAKEIWHELTDNDSELLKNIQIEYVQVLLRITHWRKDPATVIKNYAMLSSIMMTYLTMYTSFFDIFEDTSATRSDWELIIGSLLMRNIAQNNINAINCGYIYRRISDFDFNLLDAKLWDRPFHLRRGYLHCKFEEIKIATRANYSFLGLMNHSCEDVTKFKTTGRYLSCFSIKEINPSEEIFLNYFGDNDHKVSVKERTKLYHFECKCSNCITNNHSDAIYNRYRCEYSKCRCIFTPKALNWWERYDGANLMRCPKCNNLQNILLACVHKFQFLLNSVETIGDRSKLFSNFKELNRWLIDVHYLKISISQSILKRCLGVYINGSRLTKTEFSILKDISVDLLKAAKHIRKNPSLNLKAVSYFWDITAINKGKCNSTEIQEMLNMVEMAPDEIKVILMNYCDDFIRIN